MKSNITTAEEACMLAKSHGMQAVSPKDMAAFIEEIRCSQPWFEYYLSHPEITIGLAPSHKQPKERKYECVQN